MALGETLGAIFIWTLAQPEKETAMAKRRRHSAAVAHLKKAGHKRRRRGGGKKSAIKA